MRKVPQIAALFWVVKVLTTAVGESSSDFLVRTIDPQIAVVIGFAVFTLALVLQLRAQAYSAWIYWFAVSMVAVFGTMAADVLHIGFGVPYMASTVFFSLALAAIFIIWYAAENTLSIHSITTPRRETFYWLTVVTTFALGTAAGDLTASTLGLGYFNSAILFALLIAIVATVHYSMVAVMKAEHQHISRNAVAAFWAAYILTRPLGASLADWFGRSPAIGGLGWGEGPVSVILAILIIALVAYLAVTRVDVEHGRTSL